MGSYNVVLEASIELPIGTTDSTQKLTDQIEFEFRINPCQVDSFNFSSDLPQIEDIEYQLDDPSEIIGRYKFDQSPDCGYE